MRAPLFVVVALSGCLGLGCVGYESTLGAQFAPTSVPAGRSLVYLYRPSKLVGWARPIHVVVDGAERLLMVRGYAVISVPPGHHQVTVYSTDLSQNFPTLGYGGGADHTNLEFDTKEGDTAYFKVRSTLSAIEVEKISPGDGKSDIEDLHLTPGGALR